MKDQVPKERTAREWLQLMAALVGLAAAIVTGIYGIWANKAKTDAQAESATAQQDVDNAHKQIQDLQKQVQAIQSENARLREQGNPQGAPPSSPSADVAIGDIYHKGLVTVAYGKRIDLDAPPDDPQWGSIVDDRAKVDLGWQFYCDGLCFGEGSARFPIQDNNLIVGSEATGETCMATSGYKIGSIARTKVKRGLTVCVVTDEGRFSLVRVADVGDPASPIRFEVTTFMKSGD
ncbi:hypothetical protein O7602_11020 [Micromonospora sp. WMMD1128]|uniref:hypothetical protein n=1 Tax=Micromonospora sp. WMMD1128 TaxID=3015150 RepID=UPI00248C0AF1|nr:hypothetical protein [Micromonospora sp. WMMD1128]WBB76008.1 hypothetical protein O7602_11020 [Micromonospora sp. WMMD1128]